MIFSPNLGLGRPLWEGPPGRRPTTRDDVRAAFGSLFSRPAGSGSLLGGGSGGSLAGTLTHIIPTTGPGSATAGLQGLGIRGDKISKGDWRCAE